METRTPRRWRRRLGIVLLLVLLLALAAVWWVRRPWPQVDGTIEVAGLSAPVEVVRDRWGVPHLYAKDEADLFFAQGFVHAQDRLWQMEMNRRIGRGELSEILGEDALGIDIFMRTLGLRRAAEADWARMPPEPRGALEAYARGVNAFLASHRSRLPVEFSLLRAEPRPWEPVDSLVWGKVMCWNLGENFNFELSRARLVAKVGPAMTQQILPPYRDGVPLAIPPETRSFAWLRDVDFDGAEQMAAFFADRGPDWGSNNWVIHGSRTATGKPLLANDTHLSLNVPSLWYANGLHGGRFDVTGFSLPGVPMILLGHNRRIAWGVTDLIPDVQDFYVERFDDPKEPARYLFRGQWRPLRADAESIPVRGRGPEKVEILRTHHGPVMNQVIARLTEVPEPMTLRWAAVEPGDLLRSVHQLNRAGSWQEFRDALRFWDAPNLSFVYADVDGNIGFQATGNIPVRAAGHQGLVPVPGWTGTSEWTGFIPFDELPTSFNPPAGFLVTANNKVVGDDYPHFLAYEWADPFRVQWLTRWLKEHPRATLEDMRALQAGTRSLHAESLRPVLLAVQPKDEAERRALDAVRAWDLRNEPDAAGAAVFQVWYRHLLRNTIGDELGDALVREYQRYDWIHGRMMVELARNRADRWFDDTGTPAAETLDDMAARSLTDAVRWLSERLGDRPEEWRWGAIHTVTLRHQPIGESGLPVLSSLFNAGPVEAPGDRFSVNSHWFTFSSQSPYEANGGPAHRFVVDLSDLDRSQGIQNSGQSGHLFHPHREDLIPLWQRVEHISLPHSRERVLETAAARLTLQPRGQR